MEGNLQFTIRLDNDSLPSDAEHTKSEEVSRGEYLAICTILVWNGVLSMIGNSINLMVIHRVKSFKRNMKIFLILLSISDFATGMILVISTALETLFSLESETIFCKFSGYLMCLFPFISSLCLFSIALDKFIAIFYPFRYHRYRNIPLSHTAKSIVIGSSLLLWNSHVEGEMFKNITYLPLYGICLIDFGNKQKTVSIIITALSGMGVHIVGITFIYLRIALLAWRQANRINKMVVTVQSKVTDSQLVNEWKGFCSFLVVTVAFFFAWVPFWIIHFILLLTDVKVPNAVYIIGGSCTTSNSYWNPIIYTLGNDAFRTQLKQLFVRRSTTSRET